MRSRILLLASIAVVIIAVFGTLALTKLREPARKQTAQSVTSCPHDKELNTYDQWRQTISFPYRNEAKLQRIRNNYGLVDVGSSKADVLKAFGTPDYEEEGYPKEPNRPCVGYKFMYCFDKPEELNNEINDRRVEVFFKPDGRVNWIVGNIGLPEKGEYPHHP